MSNTVFVTKYALSDGIRECEVVERDVNYIFVRWPHGNRFMLRVEETHATLEGARVHADAMRAKKIASLEKQIGKLRKMTWDTIKGPSATGVAS